MVKLPSLHETNQSKRQQEPKINTSKLQTSHNEKPTKHQTITPIQDPPEEDLVPIISEDSPVKIEKKSKVERKKSFRKPEILKKQLPSVSHVDNSHIPLPFASLKEPEEIFREEHLNGTQESLLIKSKTSSSGIIKRNEEISSNNKERPKRRAQVTNYKEPSLRKKTSSRG